MKYFLLFCWIIGICTSIFSQNRQRINDEKFSSSLVKKIAISSESTDYVITGHNDTVVVVSITAITNTPKKMDELQKNYKIVTDLQNETLRIETYTGDAKGSFLVEVYVPQNIPLDISTQSSEMIIQKTHNDMVITHHSKDIQMKEIRGGKIHVNSKNGDIRVKNSAGDFQLNTNKSIEAEILDGQLTSISGGHQTISIAKSIPVMCNTQTGNIKIRIPSNAQYDCRLVSDIPLKLELNQVLFEGSINLKTMTGKLNQGTTPFKLVANKGGIWLSN